VSAGLAAGRGASAETVHFSWTGSAQGYAIVGEDEWGPLLGEVSGPVEGAGSYDDAVADPIDSDRRLLLTFTWLDDSNDGRLQGSIDCNPLEACSDDPADFLWFDTSNLRPHFELHTTGAQFLSHDAYAVPSSGIYSLGYQYGSWQIENLVITAPEPGAGAAAVGLALGALARRRRAGSSQSTDG
jgi:hypothetical protein